MRQIREILRLRFAHRLGLREIGAALEKSPSVVGDCLMRAKAAGWSWPLPESVDDPMLEQTLYPSARGGPTRQDKVTPDLQLIFTEMGRKHVTLLQLWQEYRAAHGEAAYQYSRFCELYREWSKPLKATLRGSHKAGHKTFVDWSGDGVPIVRRDTGEVWEANLFVACLGASGYTFAKAAPDRKLGHWLRMHDDTFEYFQGITELVIPDNEKTGVTSPCRYDPELNVHYAGWAAHNNTAVVPTRPRKPKDKALVENAVLNVQRWILAALRNHTFYSVDDANAEISKLLIAYNDRPMQKTQVTRRELYETVDRPALKPLPARRFEVFAWSKPRVGIDYHVVVEQHHYSVPYTLIGFQLEARGTESTVELFLKGRRVASHPRSRQAWGYTTDESHRPESHRVHLKWTPERIIHWAKKSGEHTCALATLILGSKQHPEQGFRACLGVMRLGKQYGDDRLEAACARAISLGSPSYRTVSGILKSGSDRTPLVGSDSPSAPPQPLPEHDNIRGAEHYH